MSIVIKRSLDGQLQAETKKDNNDDDEDSIENDDKREVPNLPLWSLDYLQRLRH